MNNILQLKGQFQKRKAPSGFGPVNLPKGKSVSVEHVLKLKKQLQRGGAYFNVCSASL